MRRASSTATAGRCFIMPPTMRVDIPTIRDRWAFCAPRMEPASGELVAVRARLAGRAGLVEGFGPPEALLGHIDGCDRTRMHGWIFDPAQPRQSVPAGGLLDGELVGHVIADRHRPILNGPGRGMCVAWFDLTHPIHLSPLSEHVIELRRAADGAAIPGSPVRFPPCRASMPNAAPGWPDAAGCRGGGDAGG